MITGLLCCLNSSLELVYRVVSLQVLRQKPSVHKSIITPQTACEGVEFSHPLRLQLNIYAVYNEEVNN